MAFDEGLAERVGQILSARDDVEERRMFGGLAFLVGGHMACGISGDDLMLRIGVEEAERALQRPEARPMDFTGRPMKGMVYVDGEALAEDPILARWVGLAVSFAERLPPKPPR